MTWDPTRANQEILSWSEGTARTSFVYGLERATAVTGGVTTSFGYTPLGDAVDGAAGTVASGEYGPYGTTGTAPSGFAPGFGFRGELHLGDRVYLRARDLDTRTGRFDRVDPLPGSMAEVVETNEYHYANNDPTNKVDPSGLHPTDTTFASPTPKAIHVLGIQAGLRIPGVNWCVGTCRRSSVEKNIVDPTALKYIDALKKDGAARLGVPGIIKLDKIYQSFVACSGHRKDRKCLQKLVSMTFSLGPSGTVVGMGVGGPAHAALYGLINQTTDFAIGQMEVAIEALDGLADFIETIVVGEATLVVRTYAKGYVHVRKAPSEFFVRLGEK